MIRNYLSIGFIAASLPLYASASDGGSAALSPGAGASELAGASEWAADSAAVSLQEVSVTALKNYAPLREEAGAATIVTAEELERLGAVSIKSISDVVPNFFMPDYGSRITSSIYVRGIGARMDQPSVGLIVDNVPFLNKDAYDFDISDITSVEMMRGPQSTLYGRNTMAGVINVSTLSPFRYQGWRLMGELSTRLRGKVSAGWYHLFSPSFGTSATLSYSGGDGEFRNEYNGKKLDREHNVGIRTKQQWRINGDWNMVNSLSAGWLRQGGYPYESVESGRICYNDTCFYRRFTLTDGLTFHRSGEKVNITSITSLQHIDDNMTLDQDFLPLDYFTLTQKKNEWSVTEDFVVKSARNDSRYSWLGGLFAFYKHLHMDAPVTFKDVGIRELIENHRNDNNPMRPIEWDTRTFPLESYFTIPTWGVALYHESNLQLGRFTLTGALRLDYEKAVMDYESVCNTGYNIYKLDNGEKEFHRHVDIDIDERGKLSRDFLTLLPKISVSYDLGTTGNLYASVAKGYKAGGFNTQMFSDVLQQRLMSVMGIGAQYKVEDIVSYKPEQSWNYEVGAHLNLFDSRMTLDLAAFYIDCRDQQLTIFPDGTTTGRMMANAGRTHSFGGEASISVRATERLTMVCNYGYTNARFRSFFDGINDYKGKYLPYAPQHTLFLQGVWEQPLRGGRDGSLAFDVNMRGTGKIYWNEANTLHQPFYALLGAGVTYSKSDLSVQLWGRNLTSTDYRTFYFMSIGNEFLQRGKGIEAGVTVRYNF